MGRVEESGRRGGIAVERVHAEGVRTEPGQSLRIVDCDVHPHYRTGVRDLLPYMSSAWRRRVVGEVGGAWAREIPAVEFSIPRNVLYINPIGAIRRDAIPADGSVPASDAKQVAREFLDAWGIDRALLVGGNILGLGALPDPDLAAAVAAAHNDWTTEHWLEVDERFRGAIVVAPQDPAQAAGEIDRVAERPGMAAVFVPLTNILMGERHYYPIYEAACRHRLPVVVHPNAVDGIFRKGPALAGGTPTYYAEWHAGLSQVFQANVLSLVAHGVFERFPDLTVIVSEGGFAWLPDVMWRFDKNWESCRDEIPWVKRRPSEYILEHVRFTTQPFVEPQNVRHLQYICEIIQAERTLLFSSDYPHWDFDSPLRALQHLPEETRRRIQSVNAQEVFGERL